MKRRRLTRAPMIADATLIGQKGMNMAERVVLDMGFLWNPVHIESGIDATIEIRDPSTGETTNRIVQAQVKAVSNFSAEQDDAFSFSCDRAHIRYWLGGTARVILLVAKPQTGEIYWKDLNSHFSIPENRERCTVRFSKDADRFTTACRSALVSVAKPAGGLALGPLPKREVLGINLLRLSGYPKNILTTLTKQKSWDGFIADLKAMSKPWLQEFVWEGGTLYSFFDPVSEGIQDLCEDSPKPFPTREWAGSADAVIERHFAQLLRKAFEERCYKQGILVRRDVDLFYFAAPADGGERQIATKSTVNVTRKTVVSRHSSIREDGTASIYYKHYAFHGRTRRFVDEWFWELTPTYYFTEDGKVPYWNSEALLSGIKRLERHAAVLNAFLTWKEYLTEASLFNFTYRYLNVEPPEGIALDRGIDDAAWRAPVPANGIVEATQPEFPSSEYDDEALFRWTPN